MLALFVGWIIYFFYARLAFSSLAQSEGRLRRRPQPCFELHRTGRGRRRSRAADLRRRAAVGESRGQISRRRKIPPSSRSSRSNSPGMSVMPGPDGIFGRQDMKFVSDDNVFGVDPDRPERQGRHPVAQRNSCARQQARDHLFQFQGRDSFLKIIAMRVCQDAIPGLRIPVWFTPTKSAVTRSIARSFAAPAMPP